LADGIWFVSTAGHGGIWLSNERVEKLHEIMGYKYPTFCRDYQWYEEDCDWTIPVIAFRLQDHYEAACKQLRGMRSWIDKHIFKRAYDALVASGRILDHDKASKAITAKFFDNRHDARVAAGSQSLFSDGC
jgi:hypothetical protein